jgi:ABC-type polysaccharide/polyol phosphate export permease
VKKYFIQARALTLANLKTRYRNTSLGFLWVILNPILIYGAQSYAFGRILHIDVSHYNLFLVTGLIPWIFITQSIDMTTSAILVSAPMLKSLPIHPVVLVIASVLDNLINFLAAFFILLIPLYVNSGFTLTNLLFYPIPFLLLTIAVCCLSFLLAMLQVFFRDSRYVVSLFLSISFFTTPLFYPITFVPEDLRWIVNYNFIYYFIRPFRFIFSEDLSVFWNDAAIAVVADIALIMAAVYIWKKFRSSLYFRIG